MSTIILRRHRLQHLRDLKVNPNVFVGRFPTGCATAQCKATCCKHGVWVDLAERDRILMHADLIQHHMDVSQQKSPEHWFDGEKWQNQDFPSGEAEGTALHNDACVFLDSNNRCVLQKASNTESGNLKPFFCVAFPITIDESELQVEEGRDPDCCTIASGGQLTTLEVCAEELKYVLGDEGFQELASLAESGEVPESL